MRSLRVLVLLLALLLPVRAQDDFFGVKPAFGRKRAVTATLHLSHEKARPGETVWAGVELSMGKGWHTYWSNPGDSGEETKIYWAPSEGITPGDILWPVPEKLAVEGMITYIYHDRAVLLVPLHISPQAASGERELRALVRWLECEQQCVPGSNLVSATFSIGPESQLNSDTNLFAEARALLPSKTVPGTPRAQWSDPETARKRALTVEWKTTLADADFFPYTNALATVSAETKSTQAGGIARLGKTVDKNGAVWPGEISGLLLGKEAGEVRAYEVTLPLDAVPSGSAPAGENKSLLGWLLYAFLGGLILNVMPCVLPVIALKILGFVSQSREAPGRVRTLGMLYTLGVIASFLVMAGLVIGLKAAGQKAGWGMQFSNPQFIVILTVIVTLVALNLFGLFEITLGAGTMNAASGAAHRHGRAGAFMNGVLATVLATPCTAPFLGAALGFAFAQPAHIIALIFVTVALGLASPYLVLSWNPSWLKFLPKPGVWMERFKVAMGFPMLATALWLLNLTTTFYGEQTWWLGVFLVFLGGAVWTFGTFVQRGLRRRGLGMAFTIMLLAAGYAWALENELRWRAPRTGGEAASSVSHAPEGYAWQKWSPAAVAQARAAGRPVVVDFTAKWCLTCNISVKPAFESPSVIEKLKALNAVALVADYTIYPEDITQELNRFGRSGVPMVLVYPADAAKPPQILAEPLPYPAPYAPTILEALSKLSR